jgi:imidazolonepropionase-like amidohydrolase
LFRPAHLGAAVAGFLALGGLASGAAAQDRPVAFVNARVIPIDGPEIDGGHVVVHEGRIVAVGQGDLPGLANAGARVVDLEGKVIMPGLVDTHSHIGGVGAADGSGPIQPGVDVGDSINVRSSGFKRALAGGLTTLNIMPGSGHLSSGRTVYVKLRWFGGEAPSSFDDIRVRDADGDRWAG